MNLLQTSKNSIRKTLIFYKYAQRSGDSEDSAEKAPQYKAEKISDEGNQDGLCEFFLAACEIDCGDEEDGFAGAVGDAGAAADVAVGAEGSKDLGQERGGAAAREWLDEDKFSDLGRNAEEGKEGGERLRKACGEAALFKEFGEDEDRDEVGKEGNDEGNGAFYALGEAVIEFDAAKEGIDKEDKEEKRDNESGVFHERFLVRKTSAAPSTVEKRVASRVGRMISAGEAEPAAARRAMTVVGRICRLVALSTNSMSAA